jgi:carbonic anhydrase
MSRMHSVLALSAMGCFSCAADVQDDNHPRADPAQYRLSAAEDETTECASGPGQTPIDLPLKIKRSALPDLTFDYRDSHVAIENTGETVRYNYDPGSALLVGDARYELLQFHFHAHSEHAIGGYLTPMELHLVHQDAAEHLLVVGVLIVRGKHNTTLDRAGWSELPGDEGEVIDEPDHDFNVGDLIPGGPTYRYVGSLTAPPCTGDVSWIVHRRPITLDAAQIEAFTRLYPHNARDMQALGDRTLVFGK